MWAQFCTQRSSTMDSVKTMISCLRDELEHPRLGVDRHDVEEVFVELFARIGRRLQLTAGFRRQLLSRDDNAARTQRKQSTATTNTNLVTHVTT